MLSILDGDELERVPNRQAWARLRPVTRNDLPTSFEVPLTPLLVPVPPSAVEFLATFSYTLVNDVYGESSTPRTWDDLPPSANTRGRQPPIRSFGASYLSSTSSLSLLTCLISQHSALSPTMELALS